MTYKSVTCNVKAPGTTANNKKTIQLAASYADVVKYQEGQEPTSQTVIAALPGFEAFLPPGLPSANPIAWRDGTMDQFDECGWAKIMTNKPGVKDGPDRCMTWAPLLEKATRKKVLEVDVHMIHQAFTSHPERAAEWFDSAKKVAVELSVLQDKYPGVPIVVSGDWNRGPAYDFPGVVEKVVDTPSSFGGARYDRFYLLGSVQGTDAEAITTPSDHKAVRVMITLLNKAEPLPGKPKPPAVHVPNKVENWRAAVTAAQKLPFPSEKDRPEAYAMKVAVDEILSKGPKS